MLYAVPLKNLEIWRPKDNLRHRTLHMDSSLTIISVQDNFTVVYIILLQSGQAAWPSADLPGTGGATGANTGEAKAHRSKVTQKGDAQPAKETTGRFCKSMAYIYHAVTEVMDSDFLLQQKQEVARIKKSLHTMLMQL